MIQPLFLFSDWGLLILRVVLGLVLVVHGWPKIKNLKATGEGFAGMGFKPGIFWGTVAAVTEFVGGLFLIFGFLIQAAALFIAIQFIVILLTVKRRNRLVGGYEFELLILAAALALATIGGGSFGLDYFWSFWLY